MYDPCHHAGKSVVLLDPRGPEFVRAASFGSRLDPVIGLKVKQPWCIAAMIADLKGLIPAAHAKFIMLFRRRLAGKSDSDIIQAVP